VASSFRGALTRLLQSAVRSGVQAGVREAQKRLDRGSTGPGGSGPRSTGGSSSAGASQPPPTVTVRRPPREATGTLRFDYAPKRDGQPDPGEVVWAWVPYEENDGRGKDRPVLVVSRDGSDLLALMLTSKDHDRDAADEARHGRHWLDVGSGGWDPRGRPSEVRLDRVLRLGVSDVRREGAALDRRRFDEVAAAVARLHG
jgi:hypothetical protein